MAGALGGAAARGAGRLFGVSFEQKAVDIAEKIMSGPAVRQMQSALGCVAPNANKEAVRVSFLSARVGVKMKVNEAKQELKAEAREMLESHSREMFTSRRDRSPLMNRFSSPCPF